LVQRVVNFTGVQQLVCSLVAVLVVGLLTGRVVADLYRLEVPLIAATMKAKIVSTCVVQTNFTLSAILVYPYLSLSVL